MLLLLLVVVVETLLELAAVEACVVEIVGAELVDGGSFSP